MLSSLALDLREAHFVSLPGQSNCYGLSSARWQGHPIVMVMWRRRVFCIEYTQPFGGLIPASREIPFTFSSGTELISIDCYNHLRVPDQFVIGITCSKVNESSQSNFLYIYTDWDPKLDCVLDNLGRFQIELPFVPYLLYHTVLPTPETRNEIVWLLSGSDQHVHLYREDSVQCKFYSVPTSSYFPEFEDLNSVVLCMDIRYNGEGGLIRHTAFGCEDGFIGLFTVNTASLGVESSRCIHHDSLISSVRFFSLALHPPVPPSLRKVEGISDCGSLNSSELHLAVGSMLEVAVCYWDVTRNGFENQLVLPESDCYDSAQCVVAADIDADGELELLIGTYGQMLLVYKYKKRISGDCAESCDSAPTESVDQVPGEFFLIWQRKFAHPILSVDYIDVTGDGLREVIVLSTKGLHILQHNLEDAYELLRERLAQLLD